MGRRAVAIPDARKIERLPAHQARDAVVSHFRKLTGAAGINLAQFRAQLHEEEMVELLVGFTRDITLPASLRRDCAKDVVTIARGPIQPWIHLGETIDPQAEGRTGNTVGAEIEAARLTSRMYEQITQLTMKGVPFEAWPEELKAAADPSMASFSVSEG